MFGRSAAKAKAVLFLFAAMPESFWLGSDYVPTFKANLSIAKFNPNYLAVIQVNTLVGDADVSQWSLLIPPLVSSLLCLVEL